MLGDHLFPIKDDNRNEHIVIEYAGFIRNYSEAIIKYLLMDIDDNISNMPSLEVFRNLTDDELFELSSLYDIDAIFNILFGETNVELEDAYEMFHLILDGANKIQSSTTLFETFVMNIIDQAYIKKITFIHVLPYTENDIKFLYKITKPFHDKTCLVDSANIESYVSENDDITTVMTSSIDVIKNLFTILPEERLSSILFILRNSIENLVLNEKTNQLSYNIEAENELISLMQDGKYAISRVFSVKTATTNNWPKEGS